MSAGAAEICSKLVEEGIVASGQASSCIQAVGETISKENLSAIGSKIITNVTSAGSGMFDSNSMTQDLADLGQRLGGGSLSDRATMIFTTLIDYMIDALQPISAILGITITASEKTLLTLILSVVILAALFEHTVKLFGRWTINSAVGLVTLFTLHYLFNLSIPLNLFTFLTVAVFGIPGLLVVIVMHIGGMV
ncbi:MAG: pro-sigmaK processing inhibitor BofA family protein [Candidatus Altiarchaeota archaeon]|nr:pro-sigmaK processing inhibitor BofA family protein [Candidatus Altiarchaeota archaeon]